VKNYARKIGAISSLPVFDTRSLFFVIIHVSSHPLVYMAEFQSMESPLPQAKVCRNGEFCQALASRCFLVGHEELVRFRDSQHLSNNVSGSGICNPY
jgi:hypothetical protein